MESIVLKKIRLSTLLYGIATVGLVVLTLSLLLVYFFPRLSFSSTLQAFAQKAPYPLVVIDTNQVITYRALTENMVAVKRFYENQDFSKMGLRVDFSTDEGKKRLKVREKEVLNKMLEDEVIMILARERGIFVSQEMAHQGVTRKLDEYANKERVQNDLDRLYGWNIADFEKKVVLPSLYDEKLREIFVKEADPAGVARKKIELAQQALREGGDFLDIVSRYSDGQTKETGGELGWFALADIAPELRTAVATQKAGAPGDVLESSLGFHIIRVEEVKTEKSETLYRLRQIFARKETFARWLSAKMDTISVWVWSPEYRYDSETHRIEFRDAAWKKFEEELYQNTSGDPSFLY